MNWEAVAAIGEIVGALAVVITLVYLAVQLRQNTAAVSTATYESVTSGFNAVNQVLIADEGLTGIFLRGTTDPHSLDAEEGIRFAFLMRCWANQWLKLYRLRTSGVLKQREWEMYAHEAAEAFRTPGGKQFREENPVFQELWQELDGYGGFAISSVRLGGRGADPSTEGAEHAG